MSCHKNLRNERNNLDPIPNLIPTSSRGKSRQTFKSNEIYSSPRLTSVQSREMPGWRRWRVGRHAHSEISLHVLNLNHWGKKTRRSVKMNIRRFLPFLSLTPVGLFFLFVWISLRHFTIHRVSRLRSFFMHVHVLSLCECTHMCTPTSQCDKLCNIFYSPVYQSTLNVY